MCVSIQKVYNDDDDVVIINVPYNISYNNMKRTPCNSQKYIIKNILYISRVFVCTFAGDDDENDDALRTTMMIINNIMKLHSCVYF